MTAPETDLEALYARLALEDEEDEAVVVAEGEAILKKDLYVLVGCFLTEKNINFDAMQNVLASPWRPKEGMKVHDIRGHRYTFVFYHPLDIQKVMKGAP